MPLSAERPGPLARATQATFWTFTALAVVGCLLTTAAYFSSAPPLFAQLSPFRVQYAVLLAILSPR